MPVTARSLAASMNIAEKKQLYEGIRRILKIGGRFALHDVV
jgi:hypothetical protein